MEKKNLEDLTNLVFGLALTLGAITLVKPENDDLLKLTWVVLFFALSFLVIIWIWLVYNSIMGKLNVMHRGLLALNILLLFLVAIEPFLLSTASGFAGATLYAIDLGTTLVILAVFNGFVIRELEKAKGSVVELKPYKSRRSILLVCASIFYLSIIIGYYEQASGETSPSIMSFVWFVVLVTAIISSGLTSRTK